MRINRLLTYANGWLAKSISCLMMVAMLAVGCSQESEPVKPEPTQVTLTFSPYEVTAMQAPGRGTDWNTTRAATSISTIVTHLDVWITDGTTTTDLHQTTSDANFGTITATLDRTKTYTLYAVAHKADGATLSDGVISFTDDKVTHSMFYTTTFSPATTTSLSCLMTRIVADFRMEITDDIPTSAVKFRFTIASVFDRWNVTTGATHGIDRVSTINYGGTSAIFNIYAITTDAQTLHTVTVEALDKNDQEVQSRTFGDVPLRNGYKTNYRGTFFIDSQFTSSFTINDWNEYETVDF